MRDVEVKHAARDGRYIVYEVFGSGPIDLVVDQSDAFPIDLMWDLPQLAGFMEALGQVARVLVFDARGLGASDPLPTSDPAARIENQAEDLLTVMDAAGSERASVLSFRGHAALVIAATYPRRVRSLIVSNLRSSYPEIKGLSIEQRMSIAMWMRSTQSLEAYNPRVAHDPELRRWWGRAHRLICSPEEMAELLVHASDLNVDAFLEHARIPTLVFHRQANRIWDIETSRAVAARLPNARFVELPGAECDLFLGDIAPVLAEITRFLREPDAGPENEDRQLATVLFTDIVASTEQLAAQGDSAWRRVIEDHESAATHLVSEYRGRLIRTTGDGLLAIFDGPARAVRCAAALRAAARGQGITLRAGLHTGEIEVRPADIAGIAVHIASRISALANGNEILVSRTLVDLTAGSGLEYEPVGEHQLKGVPGSWAVFRAEVPTSTQTL